MNKLSPAFYRGPDVLQIAQALLGKIIVTDWEGVITAGRIVETEAYAGITDKASHAYNGRRTRRTEIMYAAGGAAYVYLCYGIHHMFNIVTNKKDIPHAVLIRAVEPVAGIPTMLRRAGKKEADYTLTRGPGNVSKALGIFTHHSGYSLTGNQLWLAEDQYEIKKSDRISTPRIGVDYAGDDALLPYRFIIKNNPYVSGKKQKEEIKK